MGQPWAHTGSPETPGQRVFQLFQDRANPFLGQGWICFAGLQGWGDASLAHGLSMPTPHRPCCHPEGMPLSPGLGDAQVKHGSSCWGGKWLSPGCSRANENSSSSPCSSSQPGTRCPALPCPTVEVSGSPRAWVEGLRACQGRPRLWTGGKQPSP